MTGNSGQAVIAVEADDDSGPIVAAGQYAAGRFGLNCHLLSVIEPLMEVYADFNFTPLAEINADFLEHAKAQAEARLSRLAAAGGAPVNTDYQVVVGRPANVIVETAEKLGAELVVMGVHNRHGLRRLLGSTTHSVLNLRSGNLLAVHAARQSLPYRRVLVAVDTSPAMPTILRQARRIGAADSAYRVLSVCMPFARLLPVPQTGSASPLGAVPFTQLESDLLRNVSRTVRGTAQKLGYEGADVNVSTGHPAQVIIETAQAMRADLIVLGATSRSTAGRLLLGSTAHAVLNLTPCDVMLVALRPTHPQQ